MMMLGKSITLACRRPITSRQFSTMGKQIPADQFMGAALVGGCLLVSLANLSDIYASTTAHKEGGTTTRKADTTAIPRECLMMGLADGYVIQQCLKK